MTVEGASLVARRVTVGELLHDEHLLRKREQFFADGDLYEADMELTVQQMRQRLAAEEIRTQGYDTPGGAA